MNDLHRLGAVEAARRLANRELSAERYLQAFLDRIDAREPEVRAFAYLGREQALAAARALDRGPVRGPLHGLPIGVKDIFDTHDMPTQGGSKVYEGNHGSIDAACIAMSRHQGAVVIGKTVTTELATFPANETRNPRNLAHTPGGSSSGSAAGIADGFFPLATGTQTLGSTVRPAAYCGVIGYKPTFNLIPRKGVWADADSLDHVGVFASTVPDAAWFVAGMMSYPQLNVPASVSAPRIGLCRSPQWDRATPEMQAALEDAGRRLSAAGAVVRDFTLPDPFNGMLAAQMAVGTWEIGRTLADEYLRHGDKLRELLRQRCGEAWDVKPEDYLAAQKLARECRAMFPQALGEFDVLLTPAATGEAPKGLDWTGDPCFNQMWTLLYGPCVSLPAALGPNGLPLGLQVVGRMDDDARTLAAAHWVHQRLDPY